MQKAWQLYKRYKWQLFFLAGLLGAFFFCLPYCVIGTRSYVWLHDQLDGEVLNYIYHAKYLFSGMKVIPEFMNGMPADAMTPPAPMGVLFYKLLPPFAAFAVMHTFIVIVGYIGMFLLTAEITGHPVIPFLTACLFVYLPFMPVYGLTILGQPLLAWGCWQIYSGKKKYFGFASVLLYTVFSSFVLVGFAVMGFLFLVIACSFFYDRKTGLQKGQRRRTWRLVLAWCLMALVYILCNFRLVVSIIGENGSGTALHREEMVLSGITDLGGYFKEIFVDGGGNYAPTYSIVIAFFSGIVLVLYTIQAVLSKRKFSFSGRLLFLLYGIILLVIGCACFWKSMPVTAFRMSMGGSLKTFQMDRVIWLLPVLWYVSFALSLEIVLCEWKRGIVVRFAAAAVSFVLTAHLIFPNSPICHNLKLMAFPDTYHLIGWDEYYACDIFSQIDEFIGKEKSSYRTASLGITPAAALYNGFYCLDGYSNLYSLDYKHEFRKIIERELEKYDAMRIYFDTWGNRCYLFTAETGNNMQIPKYSDMSYKDLELNTGQMYKMGARYLFSAIRIDNAAEMGLELMREEPFSTSESYYAVYLYEILPENDTDLCEV